MLNALRSEMAARADQHVGLLAEFSDPGALLHAVEALRKRGYSRLDTFSPFPIHGMDRAMGLGPSLLGYLVFGGGATGALLGFLLQWWTSHVDYPINISNKPLFAWEPSIPIIFELTVLFSALTAVGGMLALNGLPKPYNPLFFSDRFARATDDGFFLHVQGRDPHFDRDTTADDLFAEGALAVEYVDHEGAHPVGRNGGEGASTPEPAAPPHTTGKI
ncbi:MAG TPA: DUF3341 domain-containing protein [Rubricoccaceae bacterium]|nr:DUF3341 domain-containing protein [Rubricoccaceae bacterium]